MTKILVVDNYDSFVFNLVQYLQQLGAEVVVKRNDEVNAESINGFDGVLLSPAAGFTSMVGPGLVITLNDAPQVDLSIPESERPDVNDLLIHQEDVQSVVNALWAGGAQGISLMGKRVIATSAVKCVGNTLLLHGKVYSPPFRIEAVGDVTKLTKSLRDDVNVAILQDYVDLFGLVYEVQRATLIELPPYEGSLLLDNVQVKRNIS